MTINLSEHIVLLDMQINEIRTSASTRSLAVPQRTDLNAAGQAVLSFRVHTEPDSGILTAVNFQVLAGNTATPTTVVFTGTYNSSVAHSVHEVLPTAIFDTGTANTVVFERLGGTGVLDVSDVYLLVNRSAPESVSINTAVGGAEG